jgi:catechol 2,3-dioxygenase-like lactoylglutathione lyase family enzyme
MSNTFVNTIVFVSDIKKSKQFYADLLGIKVKKDLERIVFFDNQLVLHCAESILNTIFKRRPGVPSRQGNNNILIYFECETLEKLEKLYHKIKDNVRIIHKIEKQEWGQKVFRFYDPDNHIVEFGEPMGDIENP